MKFARLFVVAFATGIVLSGCSIIPGVHKVTIQQGHIITEEDVSNLKLGMNKRQVRFVLGNSLSPNVFNDDRWDYFYSVRRGSDGEITRHLYTVYFENDKLVKMEGDHAPDSKLLSKQKDLEDILEDSRRDMPLPDGREDPRRQ